MLRPVAVHDVRFLRDMLRHAYHWRLAEDSERPVYRYVANWGRPGDTGMLALEGPHAYGAAWYRLFTADEPGFGFVDEQTPELTIAVVPSRRGKGAGAELLQALLDRARADGYGSVSLSTAQGQTGFYERHGFEAVRETPQAVTMVARL
ncbi:MAG TPA: GNAT family N-acetyltransferase [Gaiellaceae bacterium]|nr:GNAT family N-acetyltransferase [Gaiellaceae bacterium]